MTEKTTKNHPLEELLEIEEGSTPLPSVEPNPFMEEDIEELEIDEDEFYKKKPLDTSLEEFAGEMPQEDNIYDDVDQKNEKKFQEIYNYAMETFSQQVQEASLVEGRFRARNLEVAAQFLKIGLDSAKDSSTQKANKDKLRLAQKKVDGSGGNKTQNNFFIGDRNDLMRELDKVEGRPSKVINAPQNDDE